MKTLTMAALGAALAVAAPAQAQMYPLVTTLRAGLEGMRVDVRVSSEPVKGGHELVVTNTGDDAHILIGCFCHRGVLVDEIATIPSDWPNDRIVFGFTLRSGETSRIMLAEAAKLRAYKIPLVVLNWGREVVLRAETKLYDGAVP